MRDHLFRLWRGGFALPRAFWDHASIDGSVANRLTTVLARATLAANGPPWLAVTLHFLPSPYNVLAVVGVWRSAARYRGAPVWANAARVSVMVWAALATLA